MHKEIEYDDVKLILNGMLFTWDSEKEKINIRKHNVTFKEAASVFFDRHAFFEPNSIDEYTGEERFDVIGSLFGDLVFVVYVERITINDEEITRIISARNAAREEVKKYAYGNS